MELGESVRVPWSRWGLVRAREDRHAVEKTSDRSFVVVRHQPSALSSGPTSQPGLLDQISICRPETKSRLGLRHTTILISNTPPNLGRRYLGAENVASGRKGPRRRRPTNSAIQPTYSTIFQNESFFVIHPAVNSNRSQPLTRIFFPSRVVPVNSHSETPRSPHTKWRSSE